MGPLAATDRFFARMAAIRGGAHLLVLVPPLVGFVRHALEVASGHGRGSFDVAVHYTITYLLTQVMLGSVVSVACRRPAREVLGAVSVGLVLAWLPPLAGALFPRPGSAYFYFEEFRWHFGAPYQHPGETVAVWLGIAVTAAFAGGVTRSAGRALLAAAGAWATFQLLGWGWPALSRWLALRLDVPATMELLALFASLAFYVGWRADAMLPSLARIHHIVPCGLVAAAGARLAGESAQWTITRGVMATLAGLLVLFANDHYDRVHDAAAGKERPVDQEDVLFVLYMQVLVAAWSGGYLLPLFFLVGFVYHAPPLRLKRFFCAGYKLEGAGFAALFLWGGEHILTRGEPRQPFALAALLVMLGFAAGAMFKDYKDIERDRGERIGTIYTRLLARGRSLGAVHAFVALSTSLMMLIPPVWLLGLGVPLAATAPLFAFMLAPAVLLLAIEDRERAVKLTLLAFSVYFLVFVLVTPRL